MLTQEDKQFHLGLPSLQALLESAGPFPPGSILLGLCDDNLPFLLDLTDEEAGALLIAGDLGCGKTRLLHSALVSASLSNPPRRVAFSIIAQDPAPYMDLSQAANCMDLLLPEEDAVAGLVLSLDLILSQRLEAGYAGWEGPAILLAIDDLLAFFQSMEEPVYESFYRLLLDGPPAGIWVVATISTEEIEALDEGILCAFGILLLGYLSDSQVATYLTGEEDFPLQELEADSLFCALSGGEPIFFWVCDPE